MELETQDLNSTISNHPIFHPSHFSDDSDTPLPKSIKSKFQQFNSQLVSFSSSLKTLSSEQKAMNDRIKQYALSQENFETLKQYFIQTLEIKSEISEVDESLNEKLLNMEGVVRQLSTDMNAKFSKIDEKFSKIDRKIDAKFSIMFVIQMISILFSLIAISHH